MLGKLDATASINTSGVGLGLSTCKKIAEALHGEIFIVEDEETCVDPV
jgi:signal transduction histidine kinase